MKSLKINIFWNLLRVLTGLLFPLITFPYVTRIFGPEKIGVYNYTNSIVAYFALFAGLGFSVYGTRAISQSSRNHDNLSELTSGIFTANFFSGIFVSLAYLVALYFLPDINFKVFLIVGLLIPCKVFSFDWFYQGIEDFQYITIRSVIIQIFFCLLLFTIVKDSSDFLLYVSLLVFSTFSNCIINVYHTRKYIKLRFNLNGIYTHVKGAFVLFLGTAAISLYTYLNDVMAGAMGTMLDVGFYSTGHKIIILVNVPNNAFP